jgi:hypothetical protein
MPGLVLMQYGLETILPSAHIRARYHVTPENPMQNRYWFSGLALLVLGLASSSPVAAATIFGTLTQKGKPLAKAQLSLSCPGLPAPVETQTDDRGSYHFSVTAKGTCKLNFQSGALQAQSDVIIDPHPTQYDFEVDLGAAGARLVRR